jgi:two-component system alkaline phosphatase synthesis response regulator PhoP
MSTLAEGRSASVLVIDDQPFFTNMLRGALEQQGFRVLVANSGAEGLASAKKNLPDAILLDIEMPVMDGFAVCEQLRKDEAVKQTPIVILTATNNPKLNERAFKAGADIVALKVLSTERLVNMIRLAIGKGKAAPPA